MDTDETHNYDVAERRFDTIIGEIMEVATAEDKHTLLAKVEEFYKAFQYRKLLKDYMDDPNLIRFDDLKSALDAYKPGQILVSFDEIEKFGLFGDVQKFRTMIRSYKSYHCGGHTQKINFTPYQIVLSTERQKLTFSCTDVSRADAIKNYVKNCLDSDATIHDHDGKLHVTVTDRIVRNRDQATLLFKELIDFIEKKDHRLPDYCIQSRERTCNGTNYSAHPITMMADAKTVEEVIKMCPTAITIVVNNGVIGNVGNVNGDVINAPPKVDHKDQAKKWIEDTPPTEGESVKGYYTRYLELHPNGVNDKVFGKIANTNVKMRKVQTTDGSRIWRAYRDVVADNPVPECAVVRKQNEFGDIQMNYPPEIEEVSRLLTGCNCVYIVSVKNRFYKYGLSKNIKARLRRHFRHLDFDRIVGVVDCGTKEQMWETENKIEKYAEELGERVRKYNETEIIETNDIRKYIDVVEKYLGKTMSILYL